MIMSSVDDLRDVANLSGLAFYDQDEAEYHTRIRGQFAEAYLDFSDYIADPGFGGDAGATAIAWATAMRQSALDTEATLATWWTAHDTARAAMREAADHLPDLEAMMQEAGNMALTKGGIPGALALAAQAEALAAQYLDTMNNALMNAIPGADRAGANPDSPGGPGYESPSGTGSSSGSGTSGSGTVNVGLPTVGAAPGWTPPPASASATVGLAVAYPSPVPGVSLQDWLVQHGIDPATGLVAAGVAGLSGAAAVAAAWAWGSGNVGSLAGYRGVASLAPPGGIIQPTQWGARAGVTPVEPVSAPVTSQGSTGMGMVPPMGGAGGGQADSRRKRRDYRVPHLDDSPAGPPDPGWGAQAGSTATMPPVPEPVDDDWW